MVNFSHFALFVAGTLANEVEEDNTMLQHLVGIDADDSGPLTLGGLSRQYPKFNSLPRSEAQLLTNGWTKRSANCDPRMGYLWTKGKSVAEPLAIYTDNVGDLSGMAIMVTGQLQASKNERWFQPIPSHLCPSGVTCDQSPDDSTPKRKGHFLELAFKNGNACSAAGAPLGKLTFTQDLVVNPDVSGKSFTIPLSEPAAAQSGWVRGSCFDTMGWHYGKEDRTDGKLSSSASELYPVVPMYWNYQAPSTWGSGSLRAFFFTVPGEQATISTAKKWYSFFNAISPLPKRNANGWEGTPLSAKSMSFNFCERPSFDWDFSGTGQSKMSTMHLFGGDPLKVQCPIATLKCVTKGITKYIPSSSVKALGDIGCCPP